MVECLVNAPHSGEHNLNRRQFLATIPASALAAPPARSGEDLVLWYGEPAQQWTDALPIGNGRLGVMVWGGIDTERLQLNEDTLWSGHPRDWNNPHAREYLPEVRRLVLEQQDYAGADKVCRKMQGPYNESYLPAGNLALTFAKPAAISGYRRSLDLDSAVARVGYRAGSILYTREVFASAPDQVIVLRLSADRANALTVRVALDTLLQGSTAAGNNGELRLTGKAPAHVEPNYIASDHPVIYDPSDGAGMRFAILVKVIPTGGVLRVDGNALSIECANAVTILIAAATGFRGYDRAPDLSTEVIEAHCRKQIDPAASKPYTELLETHVADYRKLFRRVSISLGGGQSRALPTAARLRAFAEKPDPDLLALYFQYGRYLLIASSRPGSQPANLQGIWNHQVRPPWSSNWTVNINTQMNYWPAETCNLSECHMPLFDLLDGLSQTGRKTAEINYGCGGWMSHHNVDLWRQSAPVGDYGGGSPTWANWNMSAAWLCAHLWEHFAFSGDSEFLRTRAYPVMKGAAEFCLDWLIESAGGLLTTCPSESTENNFVAPDGRVAETSDGCTMDMALIRELFSNCIQAARILGIDAEFAERMEKARASLIPYQVGKYGQLQEWSKDFEEKTPGQRHMSHLYPLYPGGEITPWRTPELARAARVSLEHRLAAGGAYTGWSRAWAIGFWRAWAMATARTNRLRC